MNDTTEKLNEIYNYCKDCRNKFKTMIDENGDRCCSMGCILKRNCIFSKKKARYNDVRFVNKAYDKVKREKARKEKEEEEKDPFKQFKTNVK